MNNIIYPDGSREPITDDLLENGSDMQRKWCPLSYLRMAVGKPRKEYKGTVGVTSCLNGMRQNFLKWKIKPDIDLDGSLYKIAGISSHSQLEDWVPEKDEAEEWLRDGLVIGRSDLLEKNGEYNILVDNKFSGSYKVAKSLGIVEGEKIPLLDEFGNNVLYQKSGKGYKKGDPKMQKTWVEDPEKADVWEFAMQLNKYRRMYEKRGVRIDEMRVFFGTRDGKVYTAYNRGVMRNLYYLEIPKIPDAEVDEFFDKKSEAIDKMLTDTADIEGTPEEIVAELKKREIEIPICDERENWEGRRCENYCAFASACALFGDNPYLETKDREVKI